MVDAKASYFLNVFLGNPASSIPKGAQWAVFFDDLKTILPAIQLAYSSEPGGNNAWKTEEAARVILNENYQNRDGVGCLFCQALSIPGEGLTPVAEGIKYNGFLRSYLGAGRNDFPIMRMTFLDTNISFTDTVLRGWALATAKFGMIARSGEKNYRTNMTCYRYSITPNGPSILQKVYFEGICCVSIEEEELNYDPMSSAPKRRAQFIYHNYHMDTVTDVDPSILNNAT